MKTKETEKSSKEPFRQERKHYDFKNNRQHFFVLNPIDILLCPIPSEAKETKTQPSQKGE